jgi:hypothetical protein
MHHDNPPLLPLLYAANKLTHAAIIMTSRQGNATKCDDGIDVTICSVHVLTYARYSLTAHAKHDIRYPMSV